MTDAINSKGRLLLADDDLVFQALFEAAAIEADYELMCVGDGHAAIASTLEFRPDLIFLDRYMPGKTGIDVCRELHESMGDTCPPIVMVTGAAADKDINTAFEAGVVDYLVKPVNWLLLQYRVARWMEIGHLEEGAFEPGSSRVFEAVVSAKGVVLEVIREGVIEEALPDARPKSISLRDLLPQSAFDMTQALIRKALRTRSPQLDRIELETDTALRVWGLSVTPVGPTKANLILEPYTRRREGHSNLFRMAYIDHVTGLPNQHLYLVKGQERLLRADFEGRNMTVMCIAIEGIPRFDEARLSERQGLSDIAMSINNELAKEEHIVVLEVPHSSSACVASFDGRYALALFEEALAPEEFGRIADSLKKSLLQFDSGGRLKTRLGYARYPEDGASLDTLMESAHYAARMAVRNRVDCYHTEIAGEHPLLRASEDSEAGIYDALEKGEILMHYQPRIDLGNESVEAVEALIRWCHPVFGNITAGEIFQALAGAEAVRYLCDWAVTQAFADAKAWQVADGITPRVTVNLSHEQIVQDDFADKLLKKLTELELEPGAIELEVAESVLDCSSQSLQQFEELSDAGIGLIVDNFGAGKVGLKNLRRLRISGFKVDRQLTRAAVLDPNDSGLYSMAHAIAATCGAVLIAKNLESQDELEFARSRFCDQGQGFHICQPMPAVELRAYIEQLSFSDTSPLKIASSI